MSTTHKFWDKTARKYAKDPIKDMAGYEKTLEDTKKYLGKDKTVLEFGCGTGTTALKLAPFAQEYIATDISEEMIAIANEKKNAESVDNLKCIRATLDDDVLKDGGYDVILGYNIVHLLQDPVAGMKRIHALLKPSGVFISKTACLKESFIWPLLVPIVSTALGVGKVHCLTIDQLRDMIKDIGFDVIDETNYTKTLPRLYAVAKKKR